MKAPWKARLPAAVVRRFLGSRRALVLGHMVTARCQLRCRFCTYWREGTAGAQDEMDLPAINAMLDGAIGSGVAVYSMTGGEPLLRNDAADILGAASGRGLFTMMITNGLLLHRHLEALREVTDLLVVSLDTLSPKVYAELRGEGADIRRVMDNIVLAGRAASSTKRLRLGINCVITDSNIGELEALAGFAADVGAGISFEPVLAQPVKGCPGLSVDLSELGGTLLDMRSRHRHILNTRAYLEAMAAGERPPCLADMVVRVGPEGDVTAPCLDIPSARVVGNVREAGFGSIVSSREWREAVDLAKECRRDDCWMSCYTEPGLLLRSPAGALQDAVIGMLR